MSYYRTEETFTKKETRQMLKISRARYEQYLASGLLAAPISLVEGARPVHTSSQIRICERELYRKATAAIRQANGDGYIKPVTLKPNQEFRRK